MSKLLGPEVRVDERIYPAYTVAYQPIIHVPSQEVAAYEALLRGADGISYPEIVGGLDEAELRFFHRKTAEEAIRCAVALGLLDSTASLTINLLPDLHPDALNAEFVREMAARHGLPCNRIILELTEDHRLSTIQLREVLERNRAAGIATAMDDFGSGYSGLTALVECCPDVLKLDRLLVSNVDQNETKQTLVGAFVKVCNALKMRLVAEGVETLEECQCLRRLGVKFMQGYFFSRPLSGRLAHFDGTHLGRSTSYIRYGGTDGDSRRRLLNYS